MNEGRLPFEVVGGVAYRSIVRMLPRMQFDRWEESTTFNVWMNFWGEIAAACAVIERDFPLCIIEMDAPIACRHGVPCPGPFCPDCAQLSAAMDADRFTAPCPAAPPHEHCPLCKGSGRVEAL